MVTATVALLFWVLPFARGTAEDAGAAVRGCVAFVAACPMLAMMAPAALRGFV